MKPVHFYILLTSELHSRESFAFTNEDTVKLLWADVHRSFAIVQSNDSISAVLMQRR